MKILIYSEAHESKNGIVVTRSNQSSCSGTPQQNGAAERKNRHLLEVARAIMFTTNVLKIYWGEAILTASYLINRMPSRVLKFKTPISVFLDSYPQKHLVTSNFALKTFGCTAFVYLSSL